MYKVLHERSTEVRYNRDLNESNHISQFISALSTQLSNIEETNITKVITRNSSTQVIIFEVDKKTWWVKEPEFNLIKYALENSKTYLKIWYAAGSVNQLGGDNKINTSGIDGYELHLRFD